MQPSIILSPDISTRENRLEEIRAITASSAGALIWAKIREEAHRERDADPYLVDTVFPGRDRYSAELKGMDWTLCRGIGDRILRHALLYMVEGDEHWIHAAMRQAEVLFDDTEYPAWNHQARMKDPLYEVHLRTGMLAKDVSLMLNWLRPGLTREQLDLMVSGLEKRAIRPFREAIAGKPWWIEVNNNWLSCIVGGLGICGMALDGLHPAASGMVEFADPLMERQLEDFGPEGEFNEGLGYAASIGMVVLYYAARLGWTDGGENRLAQSPFPEVARFLVHMTVPPGRLLPFGDGKPSNPLRLEWMAALAAAGRDPVLQDFALRFPSMRADPIQLLLLDPFLERKTPEGTLPLGVAYHAHGACISSRTSWNWDRTASVVGSKARREDNHEHNDPGQVVIDGEGKPLIVDWGTPETTYPAGFFTGDRFHYFDTQAFGHNILVFGGREMKSCYVLHPDYTEGPLHGKRALRAQGHIVSSEFDDRWGGLWTLDTTAAWDGVDLCRRTVLHVFSGFVVVLDQARLRKRESISLRWNTIDMPEPDGESGFLLHRETVSLAAHIENPEATPMEARTGNHSYVQPWNKDQFGGILPERHCPYFEVLTHGSRCRFLSLFAVQPGDRAVPWSRNGSRHTASIGKERLEVTVQADAVHIHSPGHNRDWRLPFHDALQ